jgi:hypothetical protein
MQCPSCGGTISDPTTAFCPHCAAPLGAEDAEATVKLDDLSSDDAESTQTITLPPSDEAVGPPAVDVARVRHSLERGGWLDAAAAAGLGFLVLLAIGGALVLAAKLNFPGLGGAADLLGGFSAIVVAGLGCLGIPIVLDGVAVSALPLGALIAIGWGVTWAVRTSFRGSPPASLKDALRTGLQVAAVFALLCWFFALVFRFRGQHPVAPDAGIALLAGAFWGAVFGILGAVSLREPLKTTAGRLLGGLKARRTDVYEGTVAGGVMLAGAAVVGLAATLLWVIVALAKGIPGGSFGAGDAFAYVLYLVAFLPNIIVAILSLSVGAPLQVGAKVNLGGELVGPMREYSFATWGRGDPAPYLLLLLLIPVVVCGAAGFWARRRTSDGTLMVPVLLVASAVFAIALTLLAWIGELRLAGVARGSGYAAVAPDVVYVLLFSFLASGILAFGGWKLADSTDIMGERFPQKT